MDIENGKLINNQKIEKPKNSTKIYFFVIAILALLATNAYYAIRYKKLGKQVEILNSEKNQFEIEVDRLEAELNRVTGENIDLAANFKEEHDAARLLINDLRKKLSEGPVINQSDLLHTQQEIRKLRSLVSKYSTDLESIRKENHQLTKERDKLQLSVSNVTQRANHLEESNVNLEEKIKNASYLKVSGININAQRIRSGGRINTETKARRVDQLQINFTLANNPLAEAGEHTIYLRLTEPSGNLITAGKIFKVNNEDIQYTDVSTIDFKNDGKLYTIDWSPKEYDFQKGTYTVILYSNESIMGRSTVSLK